MNPQSTIGQLVVERPSRARVFEKFGIDYCCGGKKPLLAACRDKGIDPDTVLSALQNADTDSSVDPQRDWSAAPLAELATHIQSTHHEYLKAELPRLERLIQRVVNAHGQRHPEIPQLQEIFLAFQAELTQHMMKEEQVLFPLCRQLESASETPTFHCGSIANPISVMIKEHDDAGHAMETMRTLTSGYTPPEGACNTYRAMLSGLAELEADMHQHVHKENSILFPRAQERERVLAPNH